MPKIPTLLADNGVSGRIESRASAADFGAQEAAAMEQFGRGLGAAGRAADAIADRHEAIRLQLRQIDNITYVDEALSRFKRDSVEVSSQLENEGADNSHEVYLKRSNETLQAMEKGAPNKEAAQMFKSRALAIQDSFYSHTLGVSMQRKMEASASAVQSYLNQSLSIYTTLSSSDPKKAEEQLSANIDEAMQHNRAIFASRPTAADRANEKAVVDAVSGVGDINPTFARRLVEKYKGFVDGRTLQELNRRIDSYEAADRAEAADQMTRQVDGLYAVFNSGGQLPNRVKVDENFTKEKFDSIYGKHGGKMYERFKAKIDAMYDAEAALAFTKGKNRQFISNYVEQWQQDTAKSLSAEKVQAFEVIKRRLAQDMKLAEEDPVQYIVRDNPDVGLARSRYLEAKTPEQQAAALEQYNAKLLQYQGSAPQADNANPDYYLNNIDRHLLTKDQATQQAQMIMKAQGGQDAHQTLYSFLERAGKNPEHRQTLLHDLINLPDKKDQLPATYKWLAQNIDEPWALGYASSLAQSDATKSLDRDKLSDLTSKIKADPTFKIFKEALGQEQYETANGAVEAILPYALYLMNAPEKGGKLSEPDAIKQATERLLNSTISMVPVNGHYLMLPKKINGNPIPQEHLESLPQEMVRLTRQLNISELDTSFLPDAVMLGDEKEKKEQIAKKIQADSFFVLSNDSKRVSLGLVDRYGAPFLLTDKNGQPIYLDLEKDLMGPLPDRSGEFNVFGSSSVGNVYAPNISTPKFKRMELNHSHWPRE